MFFNFWVLLFKMYILEVVTFLSCLVFIQSTQFFSGSTSYKICVFHETFFLLAIRTPMITKFFRRWHAARNSHLYIYAWSFDQVTTRFIANELGKLLTLEKIFIRQTLKSSPTSCFYFLLDESHFWNIKYMITECTEFNWLCKYLKKVRSSQAVILVLN